VVVVVLVVLVLAAAAAAGIALERRLFRGSDPDAPGTRIEGLPVSELIIPVRIVVALVVAFVLVQTFSSFQDAGDHASDEAGAVLTEADDAALLPPRVAPGMVRALHCYARSVSGPDWTSLEDHREGSPETDAASRRVDVALAAAERARPDPTVLAAILGADEQRLEGRRGRLAEAESSVPGLVTALMLGGAIIVVVATAALAHPAVRPSILWAIVGATALLFAATLVVILDVDRPFGGLASVEPSAMNSTAQRIDALPQAAGPPCPA
jgi:hypothetical protein